MKVGHLMGVLPCPLCARFPLTSSPEGSLVSPRAGSWESHLTRCDPHPAQSSGPPPISSHTLLATSLSYPHLLELPPKETRHIPLPHALTSHSLLDPTNVSSVCCPLSDETLLFLVTDFIPIWATQRYVGTVRVSPMPLPTTRSHVS